MSKNRISMTITDNQLQTVLNAIATIENNLPGLIALTRDERAALNHMGDKTVEFVNKAAGYANQNPGFVPGFVSLEELNKDVDAVNRLKTVRRRWNQLGENLSDTIMLAGSEAFSSSLSIYNVIKDAANNNVDGAKNAFADMRVRFPQRRRNGVNDAEEVDAPNVDPSPN